MVSQQKDKVDALARSPKPLARDLYLRQDLSKELGNESEGISTFDPLRTCRLLMKILFFVLLGAMSWSFSIRSEPLKGHVVSPIVLTDELLENPEAIGQHILVASDPDRLMHPQGIMKGQFESDFRDLGGRRALSFGVNRNWPHWAVFAIQVTGSVSTRVLLESTYVATDRLTVYQVSPDGTILSEETLGDRVPFSARKFQYRYPVFDLNLQPGLNYVVIKVETTSLVVFDFTLYSESSFLKEKMRELVALGLMLGGIVTILIYNLFLFFSTKDSFYGLYVLYIASFFVFSLSFYGALPYFGFADIEDAPLTGWGVYVVIDFVSMSACLFAIKFLDLKRSLIWMYRVLLICVILAAGNGCLTLLTQSSIGVTKQISLVLSFIMGPALVVAGVVRAIKGFGPAVYFSVAWFFVVAGNTLILFAAGGIIEKNFVTNWSQLIGGNLEMLFLSFALGARINLIKAEKLIAEQQARESSAKALAEERRLNEQRDQLVANTSHELRTPLNGMMGMIQAIIKRDGEGLSPESQRSLYVVVSSSKRLAALIGDLLDFSRGQRQLIPLHRAPISVQVQAEHVMELLQPTLEGRKVRLELSIPDDLPPVYADPERLQQILFNLAGNACKFTEEGHIEINAKQDGERVIVGVEDTGPGIAPEAQEHIFEAFAQGDGGIARRYGGTGLGLAIVKQLVEAHGGELGLQSTPGFGSTFWFSLPISTGEVVLQGSGINPGLETRLVSLRAQIEAARGQTQESLVHISRPSLPQSQTHLHILVVDDEPTNRSVLEDLLSLNGHRVSSVATGGSALDMIRHGATPDLVLLDIMMPGMSGLQVLATLRQSYNEAELPIILLTAKALTKDLVEGFLLGASDYILKPFVAEEIEARIAHQARLKKAIWDSQSAREESNRMRLQLDHTEDQLLHAERLASIGAATAGIAHDLGNPLHHISTVLSWIRDRVKKVEVLEALPSAATHELKNIKETIDLAEKATTTAIELTQAIRVAVRTDSGDISLLDLKSVLDDGLTILHHKLRYYEYTCRCDPGILVRGKRSEMIQLVMNLVSNAADAVADVSEKKLLIVAELKDGQVTLSVEDSGPGVPVNLRSVIFDPFFTTKPSGKGSGLGLAVVRSVIKHHGGSLSVDESPSLGGARFKVMMPAA
jgi:signal transduction histidine kinase